MSNKTAPIELILQFLATFLNFSKEKMREELKEVDVRFSSQGYKTVGLAVAYDGGPMVFSAIIPMLDPPRNDTKLTIYRIREAGINVKMITGGHGRWVL